VGERGRLQFSLPNSFPQKAIRHKSIKAQKPNKEQMFPYFLKNTKNVKITVMKIVIQRVKKASVKVGNKTVGRIGQGLLLLVGIEDKDRVRVENTSEKILKLRIFGDENDKMNLSIQDVKGEILAVSQFTLLADCSGGNRPSFIKAAPPETAKPLFEKFVNELKKSGLKVETGVFGAKMEVELQNDGPVTIILESN